MDYGSRDHFREESVGRANTFLDIFVYVLYFVFIIIFGVLGMVGLSRLMNMDFAIQNILLFLICGGMAAGFWYLKDMRRIEYDYTFTNGAFDVAKIINKKRRKKIISIDVKDIEYIAPTSYKDFERTIKDSHITKKYNLFINRGGGLYYAVFTKTGTKNVMVFEPTTAMLKLFAVYKPRDILIKDEQPPRGGRF